MKKLYLLLFSILIIPFQFLQAEDTIRHLVISEWRGDVPQGAYIELTNTGDASVDLSRFTLANYSGARVYLSNVDERYKIRLKGSLEPGESYLIINVWDGVAASGITLNRTRMLPLADLKVHYLENVENDSASVYLNFLQNLQGRNAHVLWYILDSGDSVVVDAVNNAIDPNTGLHIGTASSVAGVVDATRTHILVRKADIKRGNTNWDNARGVSIEDSEWLPIPHDGFNPDGTVFTTVKVHGDYGISLSSERIGVNMTDTILNIPWGIWKGDSLVYSEMTIGPNMAWRYHESPVWADSSFNTVRTGDRLTFYALGNQLQQMEFKIVVAETAPDIARVFPLRNFNFSTGYWSLGSTYYVTHDEPVIDTIGNVTFATRVDTLFTYLEKAPGSSWEIVWVDGQSRVDLKHGDKLKVTAENGTTVKEYFIDVQEYVPSGNANLSAIMWPDKPFFMEGWNGDTIPFFNPNRLSYQVELPYGSNSVPALKANTQNLRANVSVKRAVSLSGSASERTTVFTVTSEDDSITRVYSVLFNVESPETQFFRAEPFFSQVAHRIQANGGYFEITNPGNVPLSLDQYMIVERQASGSPADALSMNLSNTEAHWKLRYLKYVPGYRFQALQDWIIKPGLLELDPVINPILDPGDVFIIGRHHPNINNWPPEAIHVNMHFSLDHPNAWGESGWGITEAMWTRGSLTTLYLFKIENDSILEGTKPIGDPMDFRLIDMFGTGVNQEWVVAGRTIPNGGGGIRNGWNFIRKPHIFHGNTEPGGSWGTNEQDSEWEILYYLDHDGDWAVASQGLGTHGMDPVTVYISTVSSLSYLVSDGFEGLQSIQGDLTGMTLEQFYMNITKADTGQELTMNSGIDGAQKTNDDLVAGNDTLVVLSADGSNTTRYLLIDQPLDNNAVLVAKDGSGYTIEIDGSTGKITGPDFGVAIKEVLENVIRPTHAILNVIDANDNLVPLNTRTTSSEYVEGEWIFSYTYVDTKSGNDLFFEVVAQDGVTVITYKLEFNVLASDAYIISSVYTVDQDSMTISGIPFGTHPKLFFSNIDVVKGASAEITDKNGFKREKGIIWYDDKLVVTSEDLSKTVTYHLDFLTEMDPDRAGDPTAHVQTRALPESLLIYPNPSEGRFYLKGVQDDEKIYVTDLMGRIILISAGKNLGDGISLHEQPSGIYIVLAIDREQNVRRARIMKK